MWTIRGAVSWFSQLSWTALLDSKFSTCSIVLTNAPAGNSPLRRDVSIPAGGEIFESTILDRGPTMRIASGTVIGSLWSFTYSLISKEAPAGWPDWKSR